MTFFNVLKVLWSNEGLAFVASILGKLWCLDDATTGKERLNFVCICVEIKSDLDYHKFVQFKLKSELIITIDVEYPWKPFVCSKCNTFGHSKTKCGASFM